MVKLKIFFAVILLSVLLPQDVAGRHRKGDIVRDPNCQNVTRECVSEDYEETDRWLVHIAGKLPVTATLNGHGYVDLGVKVDGKTVMWAACDLGAARPEQNGTRYGWAEVVSRANSTKQNCASYGKPIYRSTILGNPKYDAARKHWGGKWRMPTSQELYMLTRKCKWERAEMNGKCGFLLTSLKNGNMLFLPSCIDKEPLCYYWSSDECDMEDKEQAVELVCALGHNGVKLDSDFRYCQHAIRPVFE